MKKYLIFIVFLFILTSCDEAKTQYIETEYGLVRYANYYCDFGSLLNNDRQNVFRNSREVKCNIKLIRLTKSEYQIRMNGVTF